ncbi:protein kinase [Candidatus Villigracilis affinis]|uniref:serine/threonine protein kinase n=1 Tax=Candidatus Villigracilis affinis TaxID=3140682 RepID=UPI002A1ABC78|nr:protein kinase [Anaerolineales bacterium]
MSDVYHARDISLGQDVAIKFLRASSNAAVSAVRAAFNSWNSIDPRYTARWLGEGVAFALNGKIEDGSSEDLNAIRVHYLVMEFIEGKNIAQFLGEGVCKPDEALKIGSKIIQAVSAIHAAQWTHRDIKPDNIIISADHTIHVVDFGLSQRIDEPIGMQQGYSPGYTPPEVSRTNPLPGLTRVMYFPLRVLFLSYCLVKKHLKVQILTRRKILKN